jgi:hypothetical protein
MKITLIRIAKKIVRFWPFRPMYRATIFSRYFWPNIISGFAWSLRRTETSNFYYDLTPKNLLELANFVSVVTKVELSKVQEYVDEVRGDSDLAEHIRSNLMTDKK